MCYDFRWDSLACSSAMKFFSHRPMVSGHLRCFLARSAFVACLVKASYPTRCFAFSAQSRCASASTRAMQRSRLSSLSVSMFISASSGEGPHKGGRSSMCIVSGCRSGEISIGISR